MALSPFRSVMPRLGDGVFVHTSAQVIGEVEIGDDSSVWCNAVLRGDVNHITVGRCTNIQDLTMGHVTHKSPKKPAGSPLVIGNYVTIGHSVVLHGCSIGDECLVGMGSIIMDDVVVEDHVMIGAGTLVPPGKRLESGFLYVGQPAQPLRPLTEAERAFLRYSAEHYVTLKKAYLEADADDVLP
ncbi:gamma carbonic anhydrase family protein [Propionivibrio soli]|uniref:gamma carbonic anhydrase family protein n=1 Tax=Propionivibrio soli TaxID=2976531 RepID=UPI0021E980D7|nr:gamma carbonic anhydrase family protein [Propionivibrio soli]